MQAVLLKMFVKASSKYANGVHTYYDVEIGVSRRLLYNKVSSAAFSKLPPSLGPIIMSETQDTEEHQKLALMNLGVSFCLIAHHRTGN